MAGCAADTGPQGAGILILAAGTGRRFGSEGHKALQPLLLGEGSLRRLVRQIALAPSRPPLCVVTGHQELAVAAAVRAVLTAARCVANPSFADGSLLKSLAAGLAVVQETHRVAGVWVLFADAIYPPEVLGLLLATTPATGVVASQTASPDDDTGIGLRLDAFDGSLLALGPDLPQNDGVMAPAVYWPRSRWPALTSGAARGLRFQWQVLQGEIGHAPLQVLPLPCAALVDLDRPDDLIRVRRSLCSPGVEVCFRSTISKEERNLGLADHRADGGFRKVCQSPAQAELEAAALRWLHGLPAAPLIPTLLAQDGDQLHLELVEGIRLYELLALLRDLERQRGAPALMARAAGLTLLDRSLQQLLELQRDLLAWPRAAALPPYPLASHGGELLAVLAEVLGLPALGAPERQELALLQTLWEGHDVRLPFRDATPKNMVVGIASLAPRLSGHDPQRRRRDLEHWLSLGEAATVRLVNVDFASVGHRTAPEDDLYSLLAHAGSLAWGKRLLAQRFPHEPFWPRAVARLVPAIDPAFSFDPARAARALLVRYLRFGGRKLLYRALNPAAYAVRFGRDDPRMYFAALAAHLGRLDPGFAATFPRLLERLRQLHRAIALLPAWSAAEAEEDFYRSRGLPPVAYWRESPLENPAAEPRGGS